MLTTIQLSEKTKRQLKVLKLEKESFEDVISRLLVAYSKNKKEQEMLLRDAYNEMNEVGYSVHKKIEGADSEWPEW